jgi:lysozyme family protein
VADFLPAYNLVKKYEGYYVNNPLDRGGETYAGVARNFWPDWSGWPAIDAHKKKLGRAIKTNEKIPNMESHVTAFYQMLWNKNRFGEIADQAVANIAYDWFVNSGGTGIKGVQRVAGARPDGVLGSDSLKAINSKNPAQLHDAIKTARINFYNDLVKRKPDQATFLKGWLARINSFPTLTTAAASLAGVLLLGGLFFLLTRNKIS